MMYKQGLIPRKKLTLIQVMKNWIQATAVSHTLISLIPTFQLTNFIVQKTNNMCNNVFVAIVVNQELIRDESVQPRIPTINNISQKWRSKLSRVGMVTRILI